MLAGPKYTHTYIYLHVYDKEVCRRKELISAFQEGEETSAKTRSNIQKEKKNKVYNLKKINKYILA